MSFHIRPALVEDAPVVRALLVETWHATYDAILGVEKVTEMTDRWHAADALAKQAQAARDAPARHAFLVAEGQASAAASLQGTVSMVLAEPGILTLARLYVRPALQGQGLGRALFAAGVARFSGFDRIRLEVHPKNEGAIGFYTRLGFAVIDQGQACGGDVAAAVDHLLMEKSA